MKAKIKETESVFEPIVIKLTIESEEELCDLWQRTNCTGSEIRDSGAIKFGTNGSSSGALWRALDDLAESRGLKR